MGYICHHAIIVTTWDRIYIQSAHVAALAAGLDVSPILPSRVNSWHTFLIPPDGSNEGWEESDRGDNDRAKFIEWLNQQRFEDGSTPYQWAEIQYGDDNGDNRMLQNDDMEESDALGGTK